MATTYLKVMLFLSASLLLVVSCKHRIDGINDPGNSDPGNGGGGSAVPCDPNKIYFQQQVLPILVSNCALGGCHDDASHQDGIILTSYEKVMASGIVSPGNPGSSDLYEVIVDTDPGDRMPPPPRNPLTQSQTQIIRQWIQQGAPNLVCQSMCDSNSFTYSGAIRTLITNKCQGCHSGTAAQGGIDLSTYNGIKAKITDSRLWGSINHHAGFSPMPKNGAKLSDCEITQFKKWIEAGSPNN
ncbi:MAG: hypothetical protein JNK14_12525 [Chitinophagaceae bacterium]|nr:hypothetical protein [Chitinophagaceae bacterium]